MKKILDNQLPLIWQRAAVLGSLWASIEIIAGSALHNLKIPMGGTALSAIGAALLIAAAQKWPQRGLFWRTGLICAALKSISPSAVIIAPMIAIAMEGILLEFGTLLLGRNRAGYMLAGALAISWSLIQKILTLLLTYGTDITKLFENLVYFAQKNLPITTVEPYELVLLIYIIDLLIGCAVGFLAVNAGRKEPSQISTSKSSMDSPKQFSSGRKPSFKFLVLHVLLLVLGLAFLPNLHPLISLAVVAGYAFILTKIYHRSLARLRKPKMWIEISIVMLLAGLLLSDIWFGVRMIGRAFLVITAFSVISVELRNPIIIDWFTRRGMRFLPQAVELAFAALPEMTKAVTSRWKSWREFSGLLPTLTYEADLWLQSRNRPVFVISGDTGSGKTTQLIELIKLLKENNKTVSGIIAHGLLESGQRTGFDIEDLSSGKIMPLCRAEKMVDHVEQTGKFSFSKSGIEFGKKALSVKSDLLVIDEIGPLELAGGGWSEHLFSSDSALLIVVRTELLIEIKSKFINVIELPDSAQEAHLVIAST
jgi:nucleoside-triphosphatase THEP1